MQLSQTVPHQHALVFVDHHEARVLFPTAATADGAHVVIHRFVKSKDGHHHAMDRGDLTSVADKLRGVAEILIAGPSTAKFELREFLLEHHPDIAARIVDVVALDHATLGELKDTARAKFKRIDLWR